MSEAGLVATLRGRGGGVRLTRDPSTIAVGDVMRAMEDDFACGVPEPGHGL
jgi:Rrf2 family nitric oxide-sensitive transcriptional repressor